MFVCYTCLTPSCFQERRWRGAEITGGVGDGGGGGGVRGEWGNRDGGGGVGGGGTNHRQRCQPF